MRFLGVDPGQKRIGLALSDEEGRLAFPLRTVERTSREQALAEVAAEAVGRGVAGIVVGLPLRMDGTEGPVARSARALAEELSARAGVPVELWDERFTSAAAARGLDEAGVHGSARKAVLDQAAAVVLLQSYLDARSGRSTTEATDEPTLPPHPPPDARRRRGRDGRGRSRGR